VAGVYEPVKTAIMSVPSADDIVMTRGRLGLPEQTLPVSRGTDLTCHRIHFKPAE
jgi:hypothetical protein